MFGAIIHLCASRILKRLGSERVLAHNPCRAPSYLKNVLKEVTGAVRAWSFQRRVEAWDLAVVRQFLESSEELRNLLDELENCPESGIQRKLEELVTVARKISKQRRLPIFLRRIPGRNLNPSTRDSFLTRLGELARYRDISRHLYQSAKNIPLLRNVDVIGISLADACFSRAPCPQAFSGIDDCLARCIHGRRNITKLCQNRDMTVAGVTDKLAATARKSFTESKVHAEIQIVAYYEMNPTSLLPRVICSDKDACYLCNEFIKLHGKFYIPRTHGKLYPGWRVPPLATLDDTLLLLNERLESRIGLYYRENMQTNRRRHPAHGWSERAATHYSDSMSTLPSLPSRPVSPLTVPASLDSGVGSQSPALPVHGFQPSLLTIIESPAQPPGAEDSADSDTSTVRAISPSTTCQISEYASKSRSQLSAHGPDEGTDPVASLAEVNDTGIAPYAAEEACSAQTGLNEEDRQASITLSDGNLEMIESHVDKVTTARLVSSPSRTAGPGHKMTAETTPEQPGSERSTAADMAKGKERAEDPDLEVAACTDVDQPVLLTKGVLLKCRFGSGQLPPRYTAGLLTVIPEYVRGLESARTTAPCELHLEWLTDDESRRVTQARLKVTDVQTMDDTADVDSGSRDCVILAHGQVMLRMTVVRS